jgi:hypothetical protein
MADNIQITTGVGASAATDDIGSVHYQRVKIVTGSDGSNDGDVSASTPMPVRIGEKSLLNVSGSATTSGSVLIAASATTRIVVSAFVVQGESSGSVRASLCDTAASPRWRVHCQNQGDGLALAFPAGREWKLSSSGALVLDMTSACTTGYSISYYSEAA